VGELFRDAVEESAGNLDAALRQSVERAPLPLYLRVEDRNSMAHSVEARLPFMDYRLVSLAFHLSPEWKLRGPWNKYVLREAMRGCIPEPVRTRADKMGFPVPAARWFRTTLYEPMQDLLASERTRSRGLFNVDAIRRDLEKHREGSIDVTDGLFNVAQLETWLALAGTEVVGVGPGRDLTKPSTRVARRSPGPRSHSAIGMAARDGGQPRSDQTAAITVHTDRSPAR
jgi:asparagine synthase (glutamine-hydrolysing)